MKVGKTTLYGRPGWELDNGNLTVVMLKGGGHIASVTLNRGKKVNPLWKPVWKAVEPWEWNDKKHLKKYDMKLLAPICGHNPCLGWFGAASEAEQRLGLNGHGEACVARWKLVKKSATTSTARLVTSCELPGAGMRYTRTISTRKGSTILRVREDVKNLLKRDVPFTMCQHVTVGAPFLEKGITVFDMPATKGHTFPGTFDKRPRLKPDTAFRWPKGPGVRGGTVDMRMIGKDYRASSDFSTQLMDPQRDTAWFSALNPRLGLMFAYVWRREDYPWIGNWEENYGRKTSPWNGKTLTRAMEIANTPFPISLRDAVERGTFMGEPTFRWLPARSTVRFEYSIILMRVPVEATGVADIRQNEKHVAVDLIV